MRGHAFIAEMSPTAFEGFAAGFALEHMQPLDEAASHRVAEWKHPDFIQVLPQGNAVKIDQVRELIAGAAQTPYEGGKRLIAIHHADSMTPQAQNALLKSLEEPNESTSYLLLCRSAERLLPTVRSRCATIRQAGGGKREAAIAAGVDAKTAEIISGMASDVAEAAQLAGSAVSGEGEWAARQTALNALDALQKGGSASELAKGMPEDRQQLKQAVSAMILYFLDAMRQSAGYDRILNRDYIATLGFWAGKNPREAAGCVEICNRANSMLDSNVAPKLCSSWLFISIAEVIG